MYADILVDVLLCLVVLIGALIGLKRGFIKMAARPVKFFASLALAFGLATMIADAFIMPMLETPIYNYLADFLKENYAHITAENASTDLPTLIRFSAFILDIDIAEIVAEGGNEAVVDTVIGTLISPVIGIVANVISFIVIFIVSNILFAILFAIINVVFSRGGIGVVNRILGLVFSAAFALIVAWGLAVVGSFVIHSAVFEENEVVSSFVGGPIYNFFNSCNPIQLLLRL